MKEKELKPTTIYCLKNPVDRNRVFYVGRTMQPLKLRLYGHIHSNNRRIKDIMKSIKDAGKKPIIESLEVCTGYLLPSVREMFWIHKMNKRKMKLKNKTFSNISKKKMNYYLGMTGDRSQIA